MRDPLPPWRLSLSRGCTINCGLKGAASEEIERCWISKLCVSSSMDEDERRFDRSCDWRSRSAQKFQVVLRRVRRQLGGLVWDAGRVVFCVVVQIPDSDVEQI